MWLLRWLWKKITGAPWEGGAAFDMDADEEAWKEKK